MTSSQDCLATELPVGTGIWINIIMYVYNTDGVVIPNLSAPRSYESPQLADQYAENGATLTLFQARHLKVIKGCHNNY